MSCLRARNHGLMERYLRQELSDEELDDFETHVLECDECAQALEELAILRVGLEQNREAIERAQSSDAVRPWRILLALAAVLILAVGLVIISRPEGSELAAIASVAPPVYRPNRLRGPIDEAEQHFRAGMQLYDEEEYEEAMPELEKAAALDPGRLDVPFFLGASHLLVGDPDRAIESLDPVIEAGDTPYLEEALNLRAQAHLLEGSGEAAARDLRRVVELDGDWALQAHAQLEQIEVLATTNR